MPTSISRGRSWLLPTILGVCVLLTAFGWPLLRQRRQSTPEEMPSLGVVPDFQLITAAGRPFDSNLLKGKVWVADFIFTNCPGICPTLSARMQQLQRGADGRRVAFVSFTVDPANDTPEVLSQYAARFGADAPLWVFLTGARPALIDLIHDSFHLAVAERSAAEASDGQGLITHSDRFVLVDQASRIRGYYSVEDAEAQARLARDIARLLEQ